MEPLGKSLNIKQHAKLNSSLFEGNFGSSFGNLANNPASSNSAQNGLFGMNGSNKAPNGVVATLHGTSKNEYGTNTIGYG